MVGNQGSPVSSRNGEEGGEGTEPPVPRLSLQTPITKSLPAPWGEKSLCRANNVLVVFLLQEPPRVGTECPPPKGKQSN